MKADEFARKLMDHGARGVYWVGGCVRDEMIGIQAKDHDILVEGVAQETFQELFPEAKMTGKRFPVYRIEIDEEFMEIAFARKERKTAVGHSGYELDFSPEVTLEEDLFRRDLTINAIAQNILSKELIDPYHGIQDIKDKKIRAVSEHFKEDAVRALRAARQAAVFEYAIMDDTIQMMRECREELRLEPMERIVGELEKALSAKRPSLYFNFLFQANLLDIAYPEIYRLVGQTQPEEYHPEGDAFEHTMMVLDHVSSQTNEVKVRFAALFHDIGKGLTPQEELPKHHGHDKRGVEIIRGLHPAYKTAWKKAAAFVAKHHMRIAGLKKKGKIIQLYEDMRRNSGISMEEFLCIARADRGAKPDIPWFLNGEIMATTLGTKVEIGADLSIEQLKQKVRHERIRAMNEARSSTSDTN